MGTSETEQRRVLQGDENSVEKQVGNPVKVVTLREWWLGSNIDWWVVYTPRPKELARA